MGISDVEKMKANKDVEGLIEALKDKYSYVLFNFKISFFFYIIHSFTLCGKF